MSPLGSDVNTGQHSGTGKGLAISAVKLFSRRKPKNSTIL